MALLVTDTNGVETVVRIAVVRVNNDEKKVGFRVFTHSIPSGSTSPAVEYIPTPLSKERKIVPFSHLDEVATPVSLNPPTTGVLTSDILKKCYGILKQGDYVGAVDI